MTLITAMESNECFMAGYSINVNGRLTPIN